MARLPYTNFHDLNLDFVLKVIKKAFTPDNPPPYPVKSVNNKTGNVLLNSDDIVDVDSGLDLTDALRTKQNRPQSIGTPGQVLGLDNNLNPVWVNQSGGGGGTSDYSDLTNKPQINNVTLAGNKSGSDLGILDSPNTPGTNGQVLTSNGQGGQTWETLINDNAVGGDTDQTWSANKITQELGYIVDGLNDKIAKPSSPATGAFLVWDGSAWVAQTLSTWQGGSY